MKQHSTCSMQQAALTCHSASKAKGAKKKQQRIAGSKRLHVWVCVAHVATTKFHLHTHMYICMVKRIAAADISSWQSAACNRRTKLQSNQAIHCNYHLSNTLPQIAVWRYSALMLFLLLRQHWLLLLPLLQLAVSTQAGGFSALAIEVADGSTR